MKVLLAHTQKPATETRFWDKIRLSLKKLDFIEVKVLGSITEIGTEKDDKEAEPIFIKGMCGSYWVNAWKFYRYVAYYQPDVIVVSSPELWPIAAFFQMQGKGRLIIDLQENHSLNFEEQIAYHGLRKHLLVWIADFLENNFLPFARRVWMAEKIYANQFQTILGKSAIFENKVPATWKKDTLAKSWQNEIIKIAFTGVLTEEAGVLKALRFIQRFQGFYPNCKLVVFGYFPSEKLRQNAFDLVKGLDYVEMVSENSWKNSASILEVLQSCQAILAPYRYSKANFGKFPTKFFEAFFLGIPIILPKENGFSAAAQLPSLIELDFEHFNRADAENTVKKIRSLQHEGPKYEEDFMWEAESLVDDFLTFLGSFQSKQTSK